MHLVTHGRIGLSADPNRLILIHRFNNPYENMAVLVLSITHRSLDAFITKNNPEGLLYFAIKQDGEQPLIRKNINKYRTIYTKIIL